MLPLSVNSLLILLEKSAPVNYAYIYHYNIEEKSFEIILSSEIQHGHLTR